MKLLVSLDSLLEIVGMYFRGFEGKFTVLALLGRFPVASQRGGDEVPRDAVKEGCPVSGLVGG